MGKENTNLKGYYFVNNNNMICCSQEMISNKWLMSCQLHDHGKKLLMPDGFLHNTNLRADTYNMLAIC